MSPKRKMKYRVHKLVTWKWRKSPEPRDIQPKVTKDLGYQTAELVTYNPFLRLGAGYQSIFTNSRHAGAYLEDTPERLECLAAKVKHLW